MSIEWDYDPVPARCVCVDLETQSATDLTKAGRKAYFKCPSTRLMIAQFLHPDGLVEIWVPPGRAPEGVRLGEALPEWRGSRYSAVRFHMGDMPPPRAMQSAEDGMTWVAHNADFDANGWDILAPKHLPRPRRWHDTMPAARAAGLPGGLDAIGERVVGEGKDPGKDALKLLYRAAWKNDEPRYCIGTVPLWEAVLRYAIKDVLLLGEVLKATLPWGEPDVMAANMAINQRGVKFDRKLFVNMLDLWHAAETRACAEVTKLTGGEITNANIRSVPQVRGWLKREGFKVDSLDKRALEELFEDPEAFFEGAEGAEGEAEDRANRVIQVLRARQTATRAAKGKIVRALELADSDDRIRMCHVYYGAHTGRFTSWGVQLHNMLRGVPDLDIEGLTAIAAQRPLTIEDLQAAAAKCKGAVRMDDALATLYRAAFIPGGDKPLAIADFASVEARFVAWLAAETKLLEAFRDPTRDVYCDMAGVIFGRPVTKADKKERFVGKTTVLGAGYQMSHRKFQVLCDAGNIDLEAAGTTAEACIKAYREEYALIAGRRGLWKGLERAAFDCVQTGRDGYSNKCEFRMRDSALHMELPSGRCIVYHQAKIEDLVPGYCALLGLPEIPKPTLTFLHPRGWRASLYGGILTENASQGGCRDLMAAKIVESERLEYAGVVHVHDELACENVDSLEDYAKWMSIAPKWAAGFPMGCEAFFSPRYVKVPYKNSPLCTALMGRITHKENC